MIHALVAMRAYGETRRRMLTRRCSRCGHEQFTPEEKSSEPMTCERCAVAIPPKHAIKRSAQDAA